jgi:hypothetical protein
MLAISPLADTDLQVKVVFTLGALVALIAFWFVSPTKEDTGSFWALGKSDSVRNLVYGSDNKLRPQIKTGYTLLTAFFLIVLWLL